MRNPIDQSVIGNLKQLDALSKAAIVNRNDKIKDLKFDIECLELDVKVQKARRRHLLDAVKVIRRSIGVLDKEDISNMLDQIVESFDFK